MNSKGPLPNCLDAGMSKCIATCWSQFSSGLDWCWDIPIDHPRPTLSSFVGLARWCLSPMMIERASKEMVSWKWSLDWPWAAAIAFFLMITLWQTYKQLLKMAVYSEICPVKYVKMVMFNTYVKLPEGRHLYYTVCVCVEMSMGVWTDRQCGRLMIFGLEHLNRYLSSVFDGVQRVLIIGLLRNWVWHMSGGRAVNFRKVSCGGPHLLHPCGNAVWFSLIYCYMILIKVCIFSG